MPAFADTPAIGLKLDFKTLEAVKLTLPLLRAAVDAADSALMKNVAVLWLNADVVPLDDGQPTSIPAEEFVRLCQEHLPWAPLSLGWHATHKTQALLKG